MTLNDTHDTHGETSPELAAYLAAGGTVQRLAPGEMNWDSLSNKRRSNPCMAILPKDPTAERPLEPKAKREPRVEPAPKPREAAGPRIAQPGTQKARILALLGESSLKAAEVSQHLGISQNAACVQLIALREAGLVVSIGARPYMRWAKA